MSQASIQSMTPIRMNQDAALAVADSLLSASKMQGRATLYS